MPQDLEDAVVAQGHEPKIATPIYEQNFSLSEKPQVGTVSTDLSSHDADYADKPTEEELRTLPRISGAIPWSAYTIAFVELCERFGYYGTTVVCMYSHG